VSRGRGEENDGQKTIFYFHQKLDRGGVGELILDLEKMAPRFFKHPSDSDLLCFDVRDVS
jgi:hypothetical protein